MTRKRQPRPDWVYRPDIYDSAGVLQDAHGSYVNTARTIGPGPEQTGAYVLYDSKNYVQSMVSIGNLPEVLGSSARAEGRRAYIHRVSGLMFYRPSTWGGNQQLRACFRFGIWEQDPNSGDFLIASGYTLWTESNQPVFNVAAYANTYQWQHERRVYQEFVSGVTPGVFTARFNFRVNRRLASNECYGVLVETDATAVASPDMAVRPFLRTLVSDEG